MANSKLESELAEKLTIRSSCASENDLLEQLRKLVTSFNTLPQDLITTLSTLRRIFDNIIQHPNDDKYREIKLTNETFNSKVWQYPAAQELMKMSGWVVEGDHVRLKDESCLPIVSRALNSQFERCKYEYDVGDAIYKGNGTKLRRMLQQAQIPITNLRPCGMSLLNLALKFHQVGIARILITEYSMNVNATDADQEPCVLSLIHGAQESVIMDFINEFDVDVNVTDGEMSFLNHAIVYKCFDVVRYLIEMCKLDVNAPIQTYLFDELRFTPLHFAYATNEPTIVDYLIQHGANKNAVDVHRKKPIEYEGGTPGMIELSQVDANYRKIHRNVYGPEYKCYHELRRKYSKKEAVARTIQMYPSLLNEEGPTMRDLFGTPTLNELNRYITDMAPSYYDVGLQLDIVNSQLKLIRNDPSLSDLREKCRKTLEVWLENDNSATWKKLCDALQEVELTVLAEQIKNTQ